MAENVADQYMIDAGNKVAHQGAKTGFWGLAAQPSVNDFHEVTLTHVVDVR